MFKVVFFALSNAAILFRPVVPNQGQLCPRGHLILSGTKHPMLHSRHGPNILWCTVDMAQNVKSAMVEKLCVQVMSLPNPPYTLSNSHVRTSG